MRGDLAREERVLLAHAVLDERVADPVDERRPARLLDRARHGPARAHVVDHLLARLLREHRLREQRRDEVARDELAAVVDEEAAVGIAVVGDSEIGAQRARLLDDEGAVLREQRVRLVVRERAVGLEVALDDVELRESGQDGREHRPGHAVRGVDDDPERADGLLVHEGEHLRDEAVPDVGRSRPRRVARRRRTSPRRACRTSWSPESPPTGSAPARTIFIPVYSFGLCDAVTHTPPSSPSSPTA